MQLRSPNKRVRKAIPMTDELAFLAAIKEDPDNDLPRLIFADWLDENRQPERAELIRVQVEWARLGEEAPEEVERHRQLNERARSLIAQHGERWLAPWAGL